ncbi:hypothetical protein B0H17DRAFT_1197038 [Mycena rosella]|uniref:Uncharacterized protein n=1 Tax=Mycena rosella TaxID=1033263 RepID=A0AAD7DS25_MYCRO|nr:hypothetical protein B0H17DRAFT_1197038 [Mycena rosella]
MDPITIVDAGPPFSPSSNEINPPDIIIRSCAIACHQGLAKLAKTAAAETLRLPFDAQSLMSIPEYKSMSAHQLLLLLHFRDRCVAMMQLYLTNEVNYETADESKVWWEFEGHSDQCGTVVVDPDTDEMRPATWFYDHMESIRGQIRMWKHANFDTAAKLLCQVEGSGLEAMARCPQCIKAGPNCLRSLSLGFVSVMNATYTQILASSSFVE